MVQAPRRTGFSGPTLVRLLARLTDVDARIRTIPFRPAQPLAGLDGRHRARRRAGWQTTGHGAGRPDVRQRAGPGKPEAADHAGRCHRQRHRVHRRPAPRPAAALADAGRAQGADRRRLLQLPPALPVAAAHDGERHRRPAQPPARHAGRTQSGNDPAGDGGRHHGKIAQRARTRPHDDYSDAARRAFRAAAQGRAIGAGRAEAAEMPPPAKPGAWLDTFRRTCAACCWPNWIFVFNRWKGCSRRFAPAN